MKWMPRAALVIGVMLGLGLAIWWLQERRVPTLRVSHTLGRGSDVTVEWITLR
ncbi:MAG: hypothetical protein GYB64_03675 [Chloroflexi bacterium]|nr:hypothetical protein [Chloroflexota bacterium]